MDTTTQNAGTAAETMNTLQVGATDVVHYTLESSYWDMQWAYSPICTRRRIHGHVITPAKADRRPVTCPKCLAKTA